MLWPEVVVSLVQNAHVYLDTQSSVVGCMLLTVDRFGFIVFQPSTPFLTFLSEMCACLFFLWILLFFFVCCAGVVIGDYFVVSFGARDGSQGFFYTKRALSY